MKLKNFKIVYLAHPFTSNPKANLYRVNLIAQRIIQLSKEDLFPYFYTPVVPHLMLTVFNEEVNQDIRPITEALSSRLVQACDELWVVSPEISSGMKIEISVAESIKIPVRNWPELTKYFS